MTGARVTITVDDAEVQAALARLASAGDDLSAPMKMVAQKLLVSTRDRFASQGAPDGTPWAPISAAWRTRKEQKGWSPLILVMRHDLSTNIASRSDATSAEIGSSLPYAGIMQFGGTIQHAARSRMQAWTVKKKRDDNWADGYRYDWKFATQKKANFECSVDIGAFVQTVVARPWLGVSPDDRARIIEIFSDFFAGTGGAHVG